MWDFNVPAEISSAFVCEILADRASPHFSQNLFFVTQMKMGGMGGGPLPQKGVVKTMTMAECGVLR